MCFQKTSWQQKEVTKKVETKQQQLQPLRPNRCRDGPALRVEKGTRHERQSTKPEAQDPNATRGRDSGTPQEIRSSD